MNYGLHIPDFGFLSGLENINKITESEEENGWDGIFLWHHVMYQRKRKYDVIDLWIALATISTISKNIKFGSMITPISKQRPQIVAREAIKLDNFSKGRFILSVSLGSPKFDDFELFGEVHVKNTNQ